VRLKAFRGTILVVDDEGDVREALKLALELEGYRVFTAAHGREALEQLRAGLLPGVVLLDLMMPVMNGPEFLQAMRSDPRFVTLPVVIVTAFSRMADELHGRGLEAQGFLEKPIDFGVLLDTIAGQGPGAIGHEGQRAEPR
jgi:two-component system chemotaxis response regulator CheY